MEVQKIHAPCKRPRIHSNFFYLFLPCFISGGTSIRPLAHQTKSGFNLFTVDSQSTTLSNSSEAWPCKKVSELTVGWLSSMTLNPLDGLEPSRLETSSIFSTAPSPPHGNIDVANPPMASSLGLKEPLLNSGLFNQGESI